MNQHSIRLCASWQLGVCCRQSIFAPVRWAGTPLVTMDSPVRSIHTLQALSDDTQVRQSGKCTISRVTDVYERRACT